MSNKYKYLFLRLQELLTGVLLAFIFCFLPRKKNRVVFNSITNNAFDHNSKYLYLYLKSNPRYKDLDVYFIMNDEEKRLRLNSLYDCDDFISNHGLNKVKVLFASTWFCSTLQTPVGGAFLSFRRTVVHLGHGMPYKNIVYLENNLSWIKKLSYIINSTNFTYYLATSEFYKNIIASCFRCNDEKVLIAPQPRADAVLNKSYINTSTYEKVQENKLVILENNYNILYAPTWRHYDSVKLFPFNDTNMGEINNYLSEKSIVIWLRLHPFFDSNDLEMQNYSNIKFFPGTEFEDINVHLHLFNALITDYSSIFLDFLLLKRPVMFFDYDIDIYKDIIGLVEGFEKLKAGPSIRSFSDFKSFIEKTSSDYDLSLSNDLANYESTIKSSSEIFMNILRDKSGIDFDC